MTAHSAPSRRRSMVYGVLGNLLEWYDFTVYGFFAVAIGRLILGSGPDGGALESLTIFAIGFLARPFGGALLGSFADRFGRKRALLISVMGIVLPTLLMALLPTYEQIGILSGILLLVLRLLQGIAIGGEFTGSMVFLSELASRGHRGLATGFSVAMAMAGILLGSVVYTTLSWVFEPDVLENWGWRIAFGFGSLLGLVIWLLLHTAEESKHDLTDDVEETPFMDCVRFHWRTILRCLLFLALPAAWCYAVTVFVVVLLQHRLSTDPVFAGIMGSLAAGVPIILTPVFGALSDRMGRRPVMFIASVLALIFGVPILAFIEIGSTGVIIAAVVMGGVILAMLQGGTAIALIEQFPENIRATGTGITYNLAYAIAGGSQPVLALWLVNLTGSSYAPGWELVLLGVVSLIGVWMCRETVFDDQV